MMAAKQLKNSALLRNLTDYRPQVHNQTRWSGKLVMMDRFIQIRDELLDVQEESESSIAVNGIQDSLKRM